MTLSLVSLGAALFAFGQGGMLFFDTYRVDLLSQIFKVIITLGLFLVLCIAPGSRGLERKLLAEYYLFLTVGALGLVLLTSAHELLTIVMSLEIASFSICVLIPLRSLQTHRTQMEAAIKYFLFGVSTIGIMLFGMSYLFGLANSTYLGDLADKAPCTGQERTAGRDRHGDDALRLLLQAGPLPDALPHPRHLRRIGQ